MRVGFAGTPAFAATALASILDHGFAVPLVLTQPDRPQGRGLQLAASAVKALAQRWEVPIAQPASLKDAASQASLLAVPLDVLVVAAYGLILPPAILAWPRYGCLNVHASLLPRWRGAAPIERALLEGDRATGITLMQMDEGLDTGPMLDMVPIPIAPRETAGTLHDKLASAGARVVIDALRRLAKDGALPAVPQAAEGATYAAKVTRDDAAIDWGKSAAAIDRQVRAFDPAPGALTAYGEVPIKIWAAHPVELAEAAGAAPGTLIAVDANGLAVACGEGVLRVAELQPAGGRRMRASAFAAGRHIASGARFDARAS